MVACAARGTVLRESDISTKLKFVVACESVSYLLGKSDYLYQIPGELSLTLEDAYSTTRIAALSQHSRSLLARRAVPAL